MKYRDQLDAGILQANLLILKGMILAGHPSQLTIL
jgi:hypothetical protein